MPSQILMSGDQVRSSESRLLGLFAQGRKVLNDAIGRDAPRAAIGIRGGPATCSGLQKERGEKIGKILIDGGYCAARDVMTMLAEQLNVPLTIDGPPPVSPETEKLSAAVPASVPMSADRATGFEYDAGNGGSSGFRDLAAVAVHGIAR